MAKVNKQESELTVSALARWTRTRSKSRVTPANSLRQAHLPLSHLAQQYRRSVLDGKEDEDIPFETNLAPTQRTTGL